MKNLLILISCLSIASCADSEVGESIHDSLHEIDNIGSVELEPQQQCTNCCRACYNYNTPSQYCYWVPCVISDE